MNFDTNQPTRVPITLAERSCADAVGLTALQVKLVCALIAAVAAGRSGATAQQLEALTGVTHTTMTVLRRGGWVVEVGRVKTYRNCSRTVWAPTPAARRRLELADWAPLLFAEEDLPRVDPNAPGFLAAEQVAS